jgi:hypothetical protein
MCRGDQQEQRGETGGWRNRRANSTVWIRREAREKYRQHASWKEEEKTRYVNGHIYSRDSKGSKEINSIGMIGVCGSGSRSGDAFKT